MSIRLKTGHWKISGKFWGNGDRTRSRALPGNAFFRRLRLRQCEAEPHPMRSQAEPGNELKRINPVGVSENSPAIYCRDRNCHENQSRRDGRKSDGILPSLRDSEYFFRIPGSKLPGYFLSVPTGQIFQNPSILNLMPLRLRPVTSNAKKLCKKAFIFFVLLQ